MSENYLIRMITSGTQVIVEALCAFPSNPENWLLPAGVAHSFRVIYTSRSRVPNSQVKLTTTPKKIFLFYQKIDYLLSYEGSIFRVLFLIFSSESRGFRVEWGGTTFLFDHLRSKPEMTHRSGNSKAENVTVHSKKSRWYIENLI